MAEKSIFWTTDGTGDGSINGYTSAELTAAFRGMTQSANLGGVWPDFLDALEVTGTSSPVSVGTGAALVYGFPYDNNSAVGVNIPTPATETRIDRIVLRADWSARTVRVTRIAGVEGSGSTPALTQTPNTTWDIPLAQVEIDIAGAITITDEREFINIVADDGVTTDKLADGAVTTAKIADGDVTTAKLDDEAVTAANLASDAVETAKIKDGNVTTAKLATDAVETAKIKDANVTAAKLATDAVETAKIKDANVTTAKLADGSITTTKLDDQAVTTAKLADGNITTAKLNDEAVTQAKLGADTLRQAFLTVPIQPLSTGLPYAVVSNADFTVNSSFGLFVLDKDKLPAGATVKVGFISAINNLIDFRVGKPGGTVFEMTGIDPDDPNSGLSGVDGYLSPDIAPDMEPSNTVYTAMVRKNAGAESSPGVYTFFVLIEW